jgi:type IV secretory pathway VirD2 relaxase
MENLLQKNMGFLEVLKGRTYQYQITMTTSTSESRSERRSAATAGFRADVRELVTPFF